MLSKYNAAEFVALDWSPVGDRLAVLMELRSRDPDEWWVQERRLVTVTTSGDMANVLLQEGTVPDSFAWSVRGDALAISDRFGNVFLVSLNDGKTSRFTPPFVLQKSMLVLSPSCIVSVAQGALTSWRLNEAKSIPLTASVPVDFHPSALGMSGDGRVLAIGELSGRLRFWDIETMTELWSVRAHPSAVLQVRVSPDGSRAVTVAKGEIKVWGDFLPQTSAATKRITRLAVELGQALPIKMAEEAVIPVSSSQAESCAKSMISASNAAATDLSPERMLSQSQFRVENLRRGPDSAGAEFWRITSLAGQPASRLLWIQWLLGQQPIEPSEFLRRWIATNPKHPFSHLAEQIILNGELDARKHK